MGRIILYAILSATIAAFAATNLRDGRDPGFNEGNAFWRVMNNGDPHSIFSKDAGINGSGALVISSPDSEATSGFYAKGFVPITGGKQYTVEAMFKGHIESGHAFICARIWTNTKGSSQLPQSKGIMTVESPAITECIPDTWSSVHITFTAPKAATGIHLQLAARDFCGEIIFDDIAVYEMDDTISIPQFSPRRSCKRVRSILIAPKSFSRMHNLYP